MRRAVAILARIVIAGLIGAVLTVGVALGCAMRSLDRSPGRPDPVEWKEDATGETFRWREFDEVWGSRIGMLIPLDNWPEPMYQFRNAPAPVRTIVESRPVPREVMRWMHQALRRIVRLAGWPAECVWASVEYEPPGSGLGIALGFAVPPAPDTIGARPIGRPYSKSDTRGLYGYLPTAPLRRGVVIDVLFYSVIAWWLMRLPGTLRRWRRRRRGRCMKCGYDRAGLAAGAPCPECGEAGTPRSGHLETAAARRPPAETPQTAAGRS